MRRYQNFNFHIILIGYLNVSSYEIITPKCIFFKRKFLKSYFGGAHKKSREIDTFVRRIETV